MSRITNPTRARGQEGECFPKGSIGGDTTGTPKSGVRRSIYASAILRSLTKPVATRRCHRSLANANDPSDDGCSLSTSLVEFRELA
jgi:hypothetical protein